MRTVSATAKGLIQKVAGEIGLEIRARRDDLRFLGSYGIRTALDIGANSGQFALRLRRLLPDATIHSFEPLPDVYDNLRRRMAGQRNFFAHCIALGEAEGEAVIHRNHFTPSSSLLSLAQLHVQAFPNARQTEPLMVKCSTLDGWAVDRRLEEPLFIKIDVQGYEDRVIRGGMKTLSAARLLLIEVSFAELYRGQQLFDALYDSLRSIQFRCIGMLETVSERATGRVLQADAIFEKT